MVIVACLRECLGESMTLVPLVLVVEDDRSISGLIAELLEEAGCTVLTAGTGAQALEQVRAHLLDLVILDWMLPDIHGDQLCKQIKACREDTFLPVLMLTARSGVADRIAGL